ncbi:DeoR family transcriptional regulator [Spirochaeta thermophila]|uniref:DeoR family transcriptional regulator n=1 Tax=Winmispira thermophila TaxID=154 RepID=UPI0001F0E1E4|nr:DeoR family transcriptional regulator [Spirochaeta thermophila]
MPKMNQQESDTLEFKRQWTDRLNERQIQAVLYVKEHGKITNREFRALTRISDEGGRRDLNRLVELGILEPHGKGRSTYYALRRVGD